MKRIIFVFVLVCVGIFYFVTDRNNFANDYYDAVNENFFSHDYLDEDIYLEESDEIFEKIMMGLRLTEGICMNDFSFDFYLKYKEVINKYIKLNMLEMDGCYLKTTALGMNYLNTILIDFLDDDFKN